MLRGPQLIHLQPRLVQRHARVGVHIRRPQLLQRTTVLFGINALLQHAAHAARAEYSHALGVVILRDTAGIVVTRKGVCAHAHAAEIVAQQRRCLGFSYARAAAHRDDHAAGDLCGLCRQRHQQRKDQICFLNVSLIDFHLVAGHIPVGDIRRNLWRTPVFNGCCQRGQCLFFHIDLPIPSNKLFLNNLGHKRGKLCKMIGCVHNAVARRDVHVEQEAAEPFHAHQ